MKQTYSRAASYGLILNFSVKEEYPHGVNIPPQYEAAEFRDAKRGELVLAKWPANFCPLEPESVRDPVDFAPFIILKRKKQ